MPEISEYSRNVIGSVKAELARRDLPVAKLAEVLGYAKSTVYEIAQYRRALTTDEIERISEFLNAPTTVLTSVSAAALAEGSHHMAVAS